MRARRARARQREKSITAAVKQYVAAWAAISECESKRDREIANYQRQIQKLEVCANEELARYHAEQAAAAAALREEGQTDDDVAELLEITPRQARRLLAAARTADAALTTTDTTPSSGVEQPIATVAKAKASDDGDRTDLAGDSEGEPRM
ncbi:hypothetical protein [Nocardia iowensis]|uniref:Uncharacterized protein n=1 Tax=Nocardia iowensis TaxID=204891 RepID=A0ABX8RYI2_NOCIO|nr:hypothetical protein [Nocardia iowensis]QXN94719.1 hypothetical protein KV110_17705 [Nocardia iowensis]